MADERQSFDATRDRVTSLRNPYSSHDLDGAIIDLDHALEQEGFRVGRVKKTGNRKLMLEIMCKLGTVAGMEVQAALERACLERAAFDREAHIVTRDEGEIKLDFVTWWEQRGGGYVTGRIVVDLRTIHSR